MEYELLGNMESFCAMSCYCNDLDVHISSHIIPMIMSRQKCNKRVIPGYKFEVTAVINCNEFQCNLS